MNNKILNQNPKTNQHVSKKLHLKLELDFESTLGIDNKTKNSRGWRSIYKLNSQNEKWKMKNEKANDHETKLLFILTEFVRMLTTQFSEENINNSIESIYERSKDRI